MILLYMLCQRNGAADCAAFESEPSEAGYRLTGVEAVLAICFVVRRTGFDWQRKK
jgi:hypothetical protein